MSLFGSILKGAANIFLDSYAQAAKKTGNTSVDVDLLKDLVNGDVDWKGNPTHIDDDDE